VNGAPADLYAGAFVHLEHKPMSVLILNAEARALIRAAAKGEYRDTAKRRRDGHWEVPVGLTLYAALAKLRFPGESDSDLILRIGSPPQ
jgi:hypothetical protein